jgi:hypothetical protein
MMKLHLRTSLTLLLIGFILGFLTSFLIFGCSKGSSQKGVAVQKAKELKRAVETIDGSYQRQIDALQDQNIELQQELEVSQGLLQEAKQEAQDKEDNIQMLLKPGNDFLRKVPAQLGSSKPKLKSYLTPRQRELLDYDGIALFKGSNQDQGCLCDSLRREVTEYIQANHRKDSAYELQLITFDSVLANKDLVIDASKQAYDSLKSLFNQSLSSQTALQKENRLLRSSNSRQRFQSKVVTASMMVLSGVAASVFLRH